MRLNSPLSVCLILLALLAPLAQAYQQPSPAIREVLDAPALPRLLPSPNRQTLALLEQRRFNSIDELARPTLRLAGLRFDAASNTPTPLVAVQRLRLRALLSADAPERVVELPAGGSFHSFVWSPDGQHFLLERRTDSSNELWVGESSSGRLRVVPGLRLNNLLLQGDYAWLSSRELVVTAQPERRGPAPRLRPQPVVQESSAQASPERTHPDLLRSPDDEAQFEYHARAQLTVVDLGSLSTRPIGEPGLYSSVSTVGDGQYLLTERLARPFSYQLTWEDFPTVVELRQRNGRLLRELARVPMRQGVAIDGVLPGPRVFYASPTRDAAIYWIEALDGGNPAVRVAFRDRVMRLDPP
jgi:dipeptidyl aminopeptidase/acylaminoacyl peptidase